MACLMHSHFNIKHEVAAIHTSTTTAHFETPGEGSESLRYEGFAGSVAAWRYVVSMTSQGMPRLRSVIS